MLLRTGGIAARYGRDPVKRGLRNPWDRTQVAKLVDAVRGENGLIVEALFSDADPAQLVTDYFNLLFSMLHRLVVYLASDTIKRCIENSRSFHKVYQNCQ